MPVRPLLHRFALPVRATASADAPPSPASAQTGSGAHPADGWDLDDELEQLSMHPHPVRRAEALLANAVASGQMSPSPERAGAPLSPPSCSGWSSPVSIPSTPGTCASDVISLFDDQSTQGFPYAVRLELGDAQQPLCRPKAERWPGDLPPGVAVATNLLVDRQCPTDVVRRLLAHDVSGAAGDAVGYVLGQVLLARASRAQPTPAGRKLQRQRRGALAGWLQRLVAAGADLGSPCAHHRGQALSPLQLARKLRDAEATRLLDQAAQQRARSGGR